MICKKRQKGPYTSPRPWTPISFHLSAQGQWADMALHNAINHEKNIMELYAISLLIGLLYKHWHRPESISSYIINMLKAI